MTAASAAATAATAAAAAATSLAGLFQNLASHLTGIEVKRIERYVEKHHQKTVVDHHLARRTDLLTTDVQEVEALSHHRQNDAPPEAPERQNDNRVKPIGKNWFEKLFTHNRPGIEAGSDWPHQ